MSNNKHTPGPWMIQSQGPTEHVYVIDERRMGFVCRMDEGTQEQRTSNARLIASAPDLLASLEECRDLLIALQAEYPNNAYRNEVSNAIRRGHYAIYPESRPKT
jgi:hypothetical protein